MALAGTTAGATADLELDQAVALGATSAGVEFLTLMTRIVALVVALMALVGAGPASGKVGDLYALCYGAETNVLVPYDPVRLVPSGAPKIRTGSFGHAWSISPDRSRFVAAAGWRPGPQKPSAVRFIDLTAGRVEGTLSLPGEFRRVTATAWVRGRVLVVVSGATSTTVYSIDPDEREVISQVVVPGTVVLGERARNGLVLLLAPTGHIGPATLAVVDQSLQARTARLVRIAAGTTRAGVGAVQRTTVRRPALALAPLGERVFVFGGDGEPVAAVDLRTLTVSYAPLRWPAAVAKQIEGSIRAAATLPDGRVVVSGHHYGTTAAGVWLVDPKRWSSRVLDPAASWFRVGGGLVFIRGDRGVGLRILQPSGSSRDLFPGRSVASVDVIGPRALVTFVGAKHTTAVVELGSGRVVARPVPAHPLIGAGQPIVG